MPNDTIRQTKANALLVNTSPVTADELIHKINQRDLTRFNADSLRQTLDPALIQPRPKYQVKLSCRQTWVENKGELRLFDSELMHPGSDIAVFNQEATQQGLLIWFYGLTKKKDYFAQLKLQAYPQQLGGPALNELGAFHILANGNDFTIKPTYQEQIIPLSFLAVQSSSALIFVHGIELRQWSFREVTAKEVDL